MPLTRVQVLLKECNKVKREPRIGRVHRGGSIMIEMELKCG